LFQDFEATGGGFCNSCGPQQNGYNLIQWANGWDFITTHNALKDILIGNGNQNFVPLPVKKVFAKKEKNVVAIRDSLNRVWKTSLPLTAPEAGPARLYFIKRGLSHIDYQNIDSKCIRFCPSLDYYDSGKSIGKFPAIITMMCDASGKPSCIHRTYITQNGMKANVECPKKMMEHAADNLFGAMRIGLLGESKVLGIAEGIETALAAMCEFNIPVWPTGNSYLLENFVPPPGVDIIIFGDKDSPSKMHPKGAGQDASRALLKRLWELGIKASIKEPEMDIPSGVKSVDWLDAINLTHKNDVRKTSSM
jgi:hypothetical protein